MKLQHLDAQNDWGWENKTTLDQMTSIMLENLSS